MWAIYGLVTQLIFPRIVLASGVKWQRSVFKKNGPKIESFVCVLWRPLGLSHWGFLLGGDGPPMEGYLKGQSAFLCFPLVTTFLADLKETLNSLQDHDCKSVTHILYNLDHFSLSDFDQICFIECSRARN